MIAHMVGALVLGWFVGYERYFSGRAAGSQVYCIVCATCCAVTLLAGYPGLWYGGSVHSTQGADPTRVIASVLTGIGFLGAGLIVQSGLNVRGLTTAASIWGSSAIGILVGVGFYVAAIGLTALFVASMVVVPWIERRLPARSAMAGTIRFRPGCQPRPDEVRRYLAQRGLTMPSDSVSVSLRDGQFVLDCLIVGRSVARKYQMTGIALELANLPDIESFTIAHSSRA